MTDTRTQRVDHDAGVEETAERADWRTRLQGALSSGSGPSPKPPADGAGPGTTVVAGPKSATGPAKQPRKARLRLSRVDPWSVMKTAFLLSIALAVVTIVSVVIVWSVLGAAGVWDSINSSVQNVIGGQESQNFDVENYVGMSRVMGFTMLVAVIDVVLVTAIATLGAFLYNMSAALLGGIELTLSEDSH
ncbi:DUF3566 domain-containing protein [Nocardioides sp.]|uniref:DUF3566 domain-containing protein n=1 Tax=Nocardioides sp. TaxID=35761 RepID=UPI003D1300C1